MDVESKKKEQLKDKAKETKRLSGERGTEDKASEIWAFAFAAKRRGGRYERQRRYKGIISSK